MWKKLLKKLWKKEKKEKERREERSERKRAVSLFGEAVAMDVFAMMNEKRDALP